MKLLIVDDSRAMRDMVKQFLASLVAETRECSNGEEAVVAYTTFKPDWVLMDYQMPRMDGLRATRAILAADPEARVLFLTHYDDEELRQAAQEAGASGYVLKENLRDLLPLIGINRRI